MVIATGAADGHYGAPLIAGAPSNCLLCLSFGAASADSTVHTPEVPRLNTKTHHNNTAYNHGDAAVV